ncbi:hypothetical protein B0H11DRAFT_1173784 [Mycena galericulata]|nr:hypothetical protein B0H11DRAFT_1173784 [Mycena galericulata]
MSVIRRRMFRVRLLSPTVHLRDPVMIPAVFALLLLSQVAAQTSNVTTCIPSYDWSLNSNDQTPCLVAAILENICDGPVEVNTIPPHNHYILTDANLCQCNTVTYSLISACGGCQNRTFISWTDWATNCTQVEPVGQFLQTIPPDVAVPSWAYLNVTKVCIGVQRMESANSRANFTDKQYL